MELAGLSFVGESAKTKKQAEKNAAIAAWSALKTSTTTTTTTHYFPSFLKLTLSFVFFLWAGAKGNIMNSLSRGGSKVSENGDQIFTKDAITCNSRVMRRKRYHHQNQSNSRRRLVVSKRRSCGEINNEEEEEEDIDDDAERKQQQQGKWNKLMDLLLFIDISSKEGFSAQRKQNWLASLLPPPPPRTTSKILPPPTSSSSSSTSKPVIMNPRGNWRMQEKDIRREWLIMNHLEKNVGSGHGYRYQQQRIAPAVQIRSVIPLLAAPPMRPSSPSHPPELILTNKNAPTTASTTELSLSSEFSQLRL